MLAAQQRVAPNAVVTQAESIKASQGLCWATVVQYDHARRGHYMHPMSPVPNDPIIFSDLQNARQRQIEEKYNIPPAAERGPYGGLPQPTRRVVPGDAGLHLKRVEEQKEAAAEAERAQSRGEQRPS